jgi:nitroreductase
MDTNPLEELIKERRSVRKWKEGDISDDLLWKVLKLSIWAPNGGNYQGWQFTVVKNRELIKKMADAVQSVVDKVASWPEAMPWKEEMDRYRKNASFFRGAPVCIGVFAREYQSLMDKVLKKRELIDFEAKEILSFRKSAPTMVQSAAAAVTTMLLLIHQMGLGACWLGVPLHAKREIETLLDVPKDLALICLVAVGYPDESPRKDRNPIEEVVRFIY